MEFRERRLRELKQRAVEAEKADKRKAAFELWRQAADMCDSPKEYFECREGYLENWNKYNAKFSPKYGS